ncbi:hypothetical protein [Flavobacterium sp.]|uniref:hypothetical protein n=1 Tax=Flavobacterium sp. TaxID=239 RepID=UPI0025D170A4|nr:hypothetical protein [Flavobacterium sp.]
MKKIIIAFAFFGIMLLNSCTTNNDSNVKNNNEVFEYSNINFFPNDYTVLLTYPHTIPNSSMVLVYRLSGTFQGTDIWKLLPESYYLNNGALDFRYNFDFTRYNAQLKMEDFDLASVNNGFKLNQTFRVVVLPSYNFKTSNTIIYKNYKSVIHLFNIDESKCSKM